MAHDHDATASPVNNETEIIKSGRKVRVIGGPATPFIPWIVKVIVTRRNEAGSAVGSTACVGFLVSDMWVLTVRHLVVPLRGPPFAPTDITIVALGGPSLPGAPPAYHHQLDVDAIEFPPIEGDLVALRLTRPYRLDDYAPIDMAVIPENIATNHHIRTYGYGVPGRYVLGTTFGQTWGISPDENYPLSSNIDFSFANGSGIAEIGDSGSPVFLGYPTESGNYFNQIVIGIQTSVGRNEQGEITGGAFLPFSEYRDFIMRFLMPSVEAGPTSSINAIAVGWRTVNDCNHFEASARERRKSAFAPVTVKPSACSDIDGYRFYYKKASDGSSWDNASVYAFARSGQYQIQEISLDDSATRNDRELWDITVLPVGAGGWSTKSYAAGLNGKPLSGNKSNFYIRTAPRVSLPTIQAIEEQPYNPGHIKVTWKNSQSPISGMIKGYTLFYKAADEVPSIWDGSKIISVRSLVFETASVVIPVDLSKTYALLVLPVVAEGIIGGQDNGNPISGMFTKDQVTLIGPPKLQFQTEYLDLIIPQGSYGNGLMARFSFTEYAFFEWTWSSEKEGTYSPNGDWGAISGKNTPFLIFGSPENPARSKDSGWYKLKARNAFGSAETSPVYVKIH